MIEHEKDLAQIFEDYNQRLETLEVLTGHKYPVTSRKEFMAACMKAEKSMEECSELWDKVKEKETEKGEQAKAYPTAPYGADFIRSVIALLKKAGIKLSPEDLKKLKGLAGEQLIYVEPGKPEGIISVLPQEPGRTGEESLVSEGADLLMKRGAYSNIAHQKEIHKTKVRLGLRQGDDEI